jgi:hypothetical protein
VPNTIRITQTWGVYADTNKTSIKKIKPSEFNLNYNVQITMDEQG